MRILTMAAVAASIVGGTVAQAEAQAHAATPAGGRIDVFFPLGRDQARAPTLVTGAIGDYGTFVSIDDRGRPDANGDDARFVLKQGTFEADAHRLIAHIHPVAISHTTCSATLVASGPVRLFGGTGAYAGIHGTLRGSSRGGILLPKERDGSCPTKDDRPVSLLASIEFEGTVGFS